MSVNKGLFAIKPFASFISIVGVIDNFFEKHPERAIIKTRKVKDVFNGITLKYR